MWFVDVCLISTQRFESKCKNVHLFISFTTLTGGDVLSSGLRGEALWKCFRERCVTDSVSVVCTLLACSMVMNVGIMDFLREYLSCHRRSVFTLGSDATKNYKKREHINTLTGGGCHGKTSKRISISEESKVALWCGVRPLSHSLRSPCTSEGPMIA